MKHFSASLKASLTAQDQVGAARKWDALIACAQDLGFEVKEGAVGLVGESVPVDLREPEAAARFMRSAA